MVLFTKYKAIGALALTIVLAGLPVMAEHKPDAVLSGLGEWLWLIYPVIGLLLLYAATTLGYFLGQRDRPQPEVVAAPAPEPPADPRGRSINDLIYAVRTITNTLLEDGELRDEIVRAQMPQLERQHRAWHDHMRHQARDDFLSAVRRARQARQLKVSWMAGPGPHFGTFPAEQRDGFHAELRERRDNLVMVLQALQALEGMEHGGGPELIAAD
ncbi:hypothetical protein D1610_07905 [Sphingomonas gilva]|uniref:Uncharacterized protein n=1 Tax=Sphingomonas gilva TaxID=2305907 RepID=A0A396RV79_9SPHN|nr:hypothetical protein [Sphingomonas gilva]RHW18373.1 hypothetical protein D1610_07905 [Sphingomonas gilva]